VATDKQKKTLQMFADVLARKYASHCLRENIKPSPEGMARFMFTQDCMRMTEVNRYMVLENYPSALLDANGVKSTAVIFLADELGIGESFVWATLSQQKRFRAKRRKRQSETKVKSK